MKYKDTLLTEDKESKAHIVILTLIKRQQLSWSAGLRFAKSVEKEGKTLDEGIEQMQKDIDRINNENPL